MTPEKMMELAVELEAWSRNISDIPWSPWRLETRIKLEKAAKALRAVGAGARESKGHTPMPWRVDGTRIISTAEGIADDLICVWDGADTPNWKADAAFIVEACNSHGIQPGAGVTQQGGNKP